MDPCQDTKGQGNAVELSGHHYGDSKRHDAGSDDGIGCGLQYQRLCSHLHAPHPAVWSATGLPMIIRQGLNFAAHLFAGALIGALAVVAVRGRMQRDEPLEPRYPPPPDAPPVVTPVATEPPAPASGNAG